AVLRSHVSGRGQGWAGGEWDSGGDRASELFLCGDGLGRQGEDGFDEQGTGHEREEESPDFGGEGVFRADAVVDEAIGNPRKEGLESLGLQPSRIVLALGSTQGEETTSALAASRFPGPGTEVGRGGDLRKRQLIQLAGLSVGRQGSGCSLEKVSPGNLRSPSLERAVGHGATVDPVTGQIRVVASGEASPVVDRPGKA